MTVPDVLISEVGPRDGLQSVKATMPTPDKLRWIAGLPGEPVYGMTPEAGLPKGFTQGMQGTQGTAHV